jgi:amino acid permease
MEQVITTIKKAPPRSATVAEGVFLITGMTIGAGVLGLPYAIAQVGFKIGLIYIIGFGLLMLCLNLMIADVAEHTPEKFQLAGLAGKYIGLWAGHVLSLTVVLSSYGALLAYVVGEGDVLQLLLGGSSFWWSVVFWLLGSVVIWRGLGAAKNIQKFLSFLAILILAGLSFFLLHSIHRANLMFVHVEAFLFPYGIVLFALHGSPAIIEAKALLENDPKKLRRAVWIGTLIPVAVYVLFVAGVVGSLGSATGPVATTALSQRFGDGVLVVGNLFAALAMATSFVGLGIALKESLIWDDKISPVVSSGLVFIVPILLFVAGLRNFVGILNVVGGLFIGIEICSMIVVYWRAKSKGIFDTSKAGRFSAWFLTITTILLVLFGIILSSVQIF